MTMVPAETRATLLSQHRRLEALVAGVAHYAELLLTGEPVVSKFRLGLAELRTALEEHNKAEETAMAATMTAEPEAMLHPRRQLFAAHAAEHHAIRMLLIGSDRDVAARFPDFAKDISEHIHQEEQTFLRA